MNVPEINYHFQKIDDWKKSILNLTDKSFFQLMRSVFGSIPTPYNKQKLLDDLVTFLGQKSIQQNVAAYLDDEDSKIIAAVALLDDPEATSLSTFLSGEINHADFQVLLINLEERLLIYRYIDKKNTRRLALNPIFAGVVADILKEPAILFPYTMPSDPPTPASREGVPLLEDRTIAAIMISDNQDGMFPEEFYRHVHKSLTEINLLAEPKSDKSDRYIRKTLNLPNIRANRIAIDRFGALQFSERLEYIAAGIMTGLNEKPITGYAQDFLRESKINTLSRFIEQILASLEPNAAYPLHTIRRLVALLEKQNESALHWGDFGKPVSYAGENFIPLIEAFKLTGLLIENEDKTYTPQAFPEDKSETHIKMDGDFSCIIPPSAKFKDIWKIALFSTLNETGQVYRFEISKMSVIRGLDTGMNTEDLAPLLEKLTGNEPPQNMVYSLKDWTAQHSSVSLQTGTVLTLSPEMLYLAETPTIKRNIIRTLAPGVFILHSEERERDRKASVPGAETEDLAIRALHKAGVDILSRPSLAQSASNGRSNFPTLKRMSFQRSSVEEKAREKKNTDAATQLINRFKEFLTKKNFPQNVKDELTLRIKRKIIIDEAQLTIEAAGSEKTEARNLDIVGKTAVAKQAQITKSPVEVIWGKERAMGFIANMERKSGEYVIVVQAEGEKEPYHIPIGKVALIRRIKQSIYVQ